MLKHQSVHSYNVDTCHAKAIIGSECYLTSVGYLLSSFHGLIWIFLIQFLHLHEASLVYSEMEMARKGCFIQEDQNNLVEGNVIIFGKL